MIMKTERDICMSPEARKLYHLIVDIVMDHADESEDGESIVDDLGLDNAVNEVISTLADDARKEGWRFDETLARRVARNILEAL